MSNPLIGYSEGYLVTEKSGLPRAAKWFKTEEELARSMSKGKC